MNTTLRNQSLCTRCCLYTARIRRLLKQHVVISTDMYVFYILLCHRNSRFKPGHLITYVAVCHITFAHSCWTLIYQGPPFLTTSERQLHTLLRQSIHLESPSKLSFKNDTVVVDIYIYIYPHKLPPGQT